MFTIILRYIPILYSVEPIRVYVQCIIVSSCNCFGSFCKRQNELRFVGPLTSCHPLSPHLDNMALHNILI